MLQIINFHTVDSKIFLIALCILTLVESSFSKKPDEIIYGEIEGILELQNPDEHDLNECIINDFKNHKIANKINVEENYDEDKLTQEIKPYTRASTIKCKFYIAVKKSWLLEICIVLIIVIICASCCCCKCLC